MLSSRFASAIAALVGLTSGAPIVGTHNVQPPKRVKRRRVAVPPIMHRLTLEQQKWNEPIERARRDKMTDKKNSRDAMLHRMTGKSARRLLIRIEREARDDARSHAEFA